MKTFFRRSDHTAAFSSPGGFFGVWGNVPTKGAKGYRKLLRERGVSGNPSPGRPRKNERVQALSEAAKAGMARSTTVVAVSRSSRLSRS